MFIGGLNAKTKVKTEILQKQATWKLGGQNTAQQKDSPIQTKR